jgi:bifunctional UDP-N-acetylglucosamine pyrophosphorylase/glucosamine-1-phosphate N-acetyltransferase
MHSARPKVLHPLCGRAMAAHVLHALAESGIRRAVVVIPPDERGDEIRAHLNADAPDGVELAYAVQSVPRGTADAVLAARDVLGQGDILVINGDLALISGKQLEPLLADAAESAKVLTALVDEPARMGRIIRDRRGRLSGIVEWRDADPVQRRIREVNVGVYRFNTDFLWTALDELSAGCEERSERYVTEVVEMAARAGTAQAVDAPLAEGRLNVEDLPDAAEAEATLRRRISGRLLRSGVRITDPAAVWIDARARIQAPALIEPGSHIRGMTTIGAGSRVGPNAVIEDTSVGEHCVLESCTIRDSVLADGVEVGPYSTIRPGCDLGQRVHIGTHAELKQARLGAGVQVGHFSYLGDAEVGARANIGAGAITCNFDGQEKHTTRIGEDAFIGSDTMLIAPVSIGARARTGAGSVVTKDVPADANAVGSPARVTPTTRARSRPPRTMTEACP